MSLIVLDASALLALLLEETGHERVAAAFAGARLSTVNLAEVLTRITRDGMPAATVLEALRQSPLVLVDFDPEQALRAAELLPHTRHLGLSLGDRACLALAQSLSAGVMTADRTWLQLDPAATRVEIESIRPDPGESSA
jgi:PIN domain nuclease of toxin-antitoxin system